MKAVITSIDEETGAEYTSNTVEAYETMEELLRVIGYVYFDCAMSDMAERKSYPINIEISNGITLSVNMDER